MYSRSRYVAGAAHEPVSTRRNTSSDLLHPVSKHPSEHARKFVKNVIVNAVIPIAVSHGKVAYSDEGSEIQVHEKVQCRIWVIFWSLQVRS